MDTLRKERQEIFHAVYNNLIPKRVPINVSLPLAVVAGYAGVSMKDALWNPLLVEEAALELGKRVFSDTCVFGGNLRVPASTQAMGSINSVMSSTGFMQHPNVVGLLEEEYDEFIADPYACILEKVLPRLYRETNSELFGARSILAIAMGMMAKNDHYKLLARIMTRMQKEYGYYVTPRGANGSAYACMDLLSDNLRSFSGISSDIRRIPDKVKAATEALYPYNYKMGLPANPHPEGSVFFPLHMPTFIRTSDFEKLWWPTFKRQVEDYASLGIHSLAFCEGDWMRYLDYLQDLPTDTRLMFEYGDPRIIKEKLGKKFILTGLFPLSVLNSCSKEECIAKTREFLEIMMPGGKFIFTFDKNPLAYSDINLENLIAVCETVREYGVYDNPGETAGLPFAAEDYTHSQVPPFTSKYYRNWEAYKALYPETPDSARSKVEELEEQMLKFVYYLLF
ncbi:MAG: uroporphyrinogen decarboxylase [Firmicutes bacterium]|nr:uroporphyrinogen decarboxylase [Bacillota bacterium]